MPHPVRTLYAVLALAPAALAAQKPTAQQLFDRHAEAVGGRAAWKQAVPRTETGKVDVTFAGITGTYMRAYAPGATTMVIEIPMFGKVMSGADGTTAWSDNPQAGASKLAGAEACEANAAIAPTLFAAGTYKAAEVLDEVQFEGKQAWPVKFTSACGTEGTLFFEKATGLRIGEKRGEGRNIFGDWKKFGAITIPTTVTQGTPNGDLVISIEAVSFDPIPAATVAIPESVRKLP